MPKKIDVAALRKVVGTRYRRPMTKRAGSANGGGWRCCRAHPVRRQPPSPAARRVVGEARLAPARGRVRLCAAGEVTLVTDAGEDISRAATAGFKAGDPDRLASEPERRGRPPPRGRYPDARRRRGGLSWPRPAGRCRPARSPMPTGHRIPRRRGGVSGASLSPRRKRRGEAAEVSRGRPWRPYRQARRR